MDIYAHARYRSWWTFMHVGGRRISPARMTEYFDNLHQPPLSNLAENLEMEEEQTGRRPPLITFSHFLPLQVTALFSRIPSLHNSAGRRQFPKGCTAYRALY